MTKGVAIDLLDNLIGMVEDNHNSNYDEALKMAIKALEQEPRKGHWIMTHDYFTGAYETIDYVKCSCCGEDSLEEGDYCPNCGADMRTSEDKK